MAAFTDEEIDNILSSSGIVIDEIITAEGPPSGTVGKSSIPHNATRNKVAAWEAHLAKQQTSTDDEKGDQGSTGRSPSEDAEPGASIDPQSGTGNNPEDNADSPTLENARAPSDGLLNMLDKIASRAAEKSQSKEAQASYNENPTTKKGQMIAGKGNQVQAGTKKKIPKSGSPQSGDRDTGESTQYHGAQKGSSPQAGATQTVHPSHQHPSSSPVDAANALNFADFAHAMLGMMESMNHRMSKLEYSIELILKHVSCCPLIRTDIQQLKTAVAVMEGNISMMKLMDPGNANISSLNDLRKVSQLRPVLIAGPGDPSPYVANDGSIAVNQLSQPVTNRDELVKTLVPQAPDLMVKKESVGALIKSRPMHPAAAKRLLDKLASATTIDDIKKVKRLALNG
ncbi:phosphoprotein [avian paramyxovirus 13]|uniref:Phosphoprotein n=1 Tax=avian paramyxovirus 13 TaxID=2560321 RepID=A0A173M8Y4_9MONO|nr:phosphoprotein [Avian paramyxovirus goose/Shimane/67/2000]BAV03981.1 phosphoprotein [Avian paramyxovirus goose/Shimane/67/2000]